MPKYSDGDILDSNARTLCFAASSMLSPIDIHGQKDRQIAPMSKMSALASALAEHEPKLPTIIATQFSKAKLFHQVSGVVPMMSVKLEDGRYVSPFIVRRNNTDAIDAKLIIQSCDSLYRYILSHILANNFPEIALERPYDAGKMYDTFISTLPETVTVHKERRA